MPLNDKAHMHFVDSSDIHTLHSVCEPSLIPRSPSLGYETGVSPTNESSVIGSDVQVCHQRHSSALDLLIFLCSLIQTLTLTPPPNNALLANMDMRCDRTLLMCNVIELHNRITTDYHTRYVTLIMLHPLTSR